MTATSESLSLQGSDGGDSWPGKRLRASEPVNSPRHHDIEISPTSISQHPIETRALRTTFGAADAEVRIDLHDVPAAALRDPSQFPYLVLDRLGVGAEKARAAIRYIDDEHLLEPHRGRSGRLTPT
jgi:hypothetical protein